MTSMKAIDDELKRQEDLRAELASSEIRVQKTLAVVPKSELLPLIAKAVVEHARALGTYAAYGGAHNDGGESVLLREVERWQQGMRGEIPDDWKLFLPRRLGGSK